MWTGLAYLSAMTRTSEGPAGMSMETIASLFCKGDEITQEVLIGDDEFSKWYLAPAICLWKGLKKMLIYTWTIIFAAVTYWFPGPNIFSTYQK